MKIPAGHPVYDLWWTAPTHRAIKRCPPSLCPSVCMSVCLSVRCFSTSRMENRKLRTGIYVSMTSEGETYWANFTPGGQRSMEPGFTKLRNHMRHNWWTDGHTPCKIRRACGHPLYTASALGGLGKGKGKVAVRSSVNYINIHCKLTATCWPFDLDRWHFHGTTFSSQHALFGAKLPHRVPKKRSHFYFFNNSVKC